MTPKSLGKGISALIPDYSEVEGEEQNIAEILVDNIRSNPLQPREDFSTEEMEELKRSILEKGIVQPITVRKVDEGFEVIAGERRLRAVKSLNIRTIPAYIIKVDSEAELLEIALVENLHREDLNPINLAEAYRKLMERWGLSHEEVAKKVGKERSTVTNVLRLLKLPREIKESLKKGEITPGHARALLASGSRGEQIKLWRRIKKYSLSVRQVENEVKKLLEMEEKAEKRVSPPKPPFMRRIEDELIEILGTKVKIRGKGKGGVIYIEYYSPEDLERLMELFEKID
ncbi:MAG: ParB/RepB/Spo0J family partition protein [Fidelibacterota bacterium]